MRIPVLAFLLASTVTPAVAADLVLYGAGSLREAVSEIVQAWGEKHGVTVRTDFGPSGRMRERIEHGEAVDVFTSADTGHPAKLVADGKARVMALFAKNALCMIAPNAAALTTDRVNDALLDPALHLGISPARVDPLGDYTEVLFSKLDAMHPGAGAALRSRALVLDTPPGAPSPRSGDVTTDAFLDGKIGAAIVYCSGQARYAKLLPDARMTALPPVLETGPEYGLAVVSARPEAMSLALAILSPEGQRVLARWGFKPVGLPTTP